MLDKLYARRYTVHFRTEEAMLLPAYKGATFRGALGFAFKKVACALPRKNCPACLLRHRCAYSVCFETPVPERTAMMRRYPYAPHPFVIEPPADLKTRYEAGEALDVGLCIVGKANEYLPQFIYAFEEMAGAGLGRDRAKASLLSLTAMEDGRERTVYDHASERLEGEAPTIDSSGVADRAKALEDRDLRITFETPMRLKVKGHFCEEPALGNLFPALLRRLGALGYFFCDGEPDHDVHPLLEAARATETRASHVAWQDWSRYSSRQQVRMQLGGFTGSATYTCPAPELLPYLLWGEQLHLGKASAFGLGKYRVDAPGGDSEGGPASCLSMNIRET